MKETLLLTKHMREYPEDSHLIETYEKNNGYRALKKVLKEDNPEDVINEIKNSNIRGRGGAGFPTGVKWGFLAENEDRYLVINGDESEPGTFKDRHVLTTAPHQFLEGVLIAAAIGGVREVYIYLRAEYPDCYIILQQELEAIKRAGLIGDVVVHLRRGKIAFE